jgi:hypothetical protein
MLEQIKKIVDDFGGFSEEDEIYVVVKKDILKEVEDYLKTESRWLGYEVEVIKNSNDTCLIRMYA